LGNFEQLIKKNISLKHLEIQMLWQNDYITKEHQNRTKSDKKPNELDGMNKLVNFSKVFNRRKSVEKEVVHQIEKFFRTQQDKIKKILEVGSKKEKKPIPKNKRHKIKMLIQDADIEFLEVNDKIGVIPFNEDKFLLKEGFFMAILGILSRNQGQRDGKRTFFEIHKIIESTIEKKVDLLLNHQLFPKEFILSSLLEASLFLSLHPEKENMRIVSNFKIFKLIKYKQNGILASKIHNILDQVNLVNKGTTLLLKQDTCWNHFMIHVKIADNKVKLNIELVNDGYQLNVLDFNRSIFVIVNNEIIYNSFEYFENLFINIEVGLEFKQ
jgi:hypothetical protein